MSRVLKLGFSNGNVHGIGQKVIMIENTPATCPLLKFSVEISESNLVYRNVIEAEIYWELLLSGQVEQNWAKSHPAVRHPFYEKK